MSLKIKCFATLVSEKILINDSIIVSEKIFIHDSMFELSSSDFFAACNNTKRQQGRFSIDVVLGEEPTKRKLPLDLDGILTDFCFEQWKSLIPIPLARQLIKQDTYEVDEFICSRYWLRGRYFFVTNRPYEQYEECLVIHQVNEKTIEFINLIRQASIQS
jgi:hypothetical protein